MTAYEIFMLDSRPDREENKLTPEQKLSFLDSLLKEHEALQTELKKHKSVSAAWQSRAIAAENDIEALEDALDDDVEPPEDLGKVQAPGWCPSCKQLKEENQELKRKIKTLDAYIEELKMLHRYIAKQGAEGRI